MKFPAGVKGTPMNVHMMHHISEMWGPLWAYSTFQFENVNGYLKYLFHVTRDMTKQVCDRSIMEFKYTYTRASSYSTRQKKYPFRWRCTVKRYCETVIKTVRKTE